VAVVEAQEIALVVALAVQAEVVQEALMVALAQLEL
jgi:hypothetical protein